MSKWAQMLREQALFAGKLFVGWHIISEYGVQLTAVSVVVVVVVVVAVVVVVFE